MALSTSPKRSFSEAGLDDEGGVPLEINLTKEEGTLPISMSPTKSTLNATTEPVEQHPGDAETYSPQLDSKNKAPVQTNPASFASVVGKPNKKIKLNPAEKEQRERQRVEERARKESERLQREHERAQKAQEKKEREEQKQAEKEEQQKIKREKEKVKEEKKQKLEEEKQKKEGERRKKEEEKEKKARSQLRLNAFFTAPGATTGGTRESPGVDRSPLNSRRSSLADINAWESEHRSRSLSATPSKTKKSDYRRYFPDFFLQSHTTLAPTSYFAQDKERMLDVEKAIDEALESTISGKQPKAAEISRPALWPKSKRACSHVTITLKEVVERLNGSASNPIDLTAQPKPAPSERGLELLRTIPLKSIKFAEDVRPPYVGTYTKTPLNRSLHSIGRKPFSRVRPDTNYDYDSEAEWEDPGEGEDLTSEGEEEVDDEEDDADLEGFLDDEDANDIARPVKRKPLLGDLVPTSSGICWEGEKLSLDGEPCPDFSRYALEVLLDNPCFPIDPYSTAYWQPPLPPKSLNSKIAGPHQTTLMEPPRIPLHPVNHRGNTLLLPSSAQLSSSPSSIDGSHPKLVRPTAEVLPLTNSHPSHPGGTVPTKHPAAPGMTAPKAPKRYIAPELLGAFKAAVQGSDLTKMGLVEVLKKQFPKQPKDAIKDTLEELAVRVGEKNADKRWVLKE